MAIVENQQYRRRETYFVLFNLENRPTSEAVVAALHQVNEHYELADVRKDEQGQLESLTILSPDDYAAMDITLVTGEEVKEHTIEVVEEMMPLMTGEEKQRLRTLPEFDARLDVYHFEQTVFEGPAGDEDPDEFMDPGSLLIVLEKLAELTQGVGVDQESGTLI